MDKVLFVGDPHLSSVQYGTRLDNSVETCLTKVRFIFDTARERQAAIVFAGDVLNNNANNSLFLLRLIRLINEYQDVPCYSIAGNHECKGNDYSSYENSQMYYLYYGTHLKFLEEPLLLDSGYLLGYHAYSRNDYDIDSTKVVAIACHHFLIDSFGDSLVIYPDKEKEKYPNLKYILAGHDHSYYETVTTPQGVKLVRPGSMLRTDSSKHNQRNPKVTLIDFSSLTEEEINIPCLPYNEVFNTVVKSEDKKTESSIKGFIASFQEATRNNKVASIEQVLSQELSRVKKEEHRNIIEKDLISNGFIGGQRGNN